MFEKLELFLFFILLISGFSFLSLAPWLPTRTSDLERLDKIIGLKPGEKFLEIGCGTAKVSLFLAKNNPDSEITGIELSPLFFFISKIKVYFSGQKNIKIIYGNALKLDFKNYDVFYIFGLPETIQGKIFPKLKNEVKENSRFYSYCFNMNNNIFKEKKYKENKNVYAIYEYSI